VTLCVYAITASPCAPGVSGVRLRAIGAGRVWASAAPVRRAPAVTPASLRRYHRTVTAIAAASPAVLPVRFGTVIDEAELRAVLRSRRAVLATALRKVRGQVQMTVRLIERGTRPGRTAALAVPRSGREYLQARADRVSSRSIPGFAPVRQALGRWMREERVERTSGVTSIYHLVPGRAAGTYRQTALAALEGAGLRAVVSGPFPSYAFTSF
jgi:gas vesicle protein GvpL/GvpF